MGCVTACAAGKAAQVPRTLNIDKSKEAKRLVPWDLMDVCAKKHVLDNSDGDITSGQFMGPYSKIHLARPHLHGATATPADRAGAVARQV